jgi:RNA polymerase sigma factor (sigma-70 family)
MQATAVFAPATPRIVPLSRMGDEALASRAAAGNEAAFTALYERYHGPLLSYCRSILLDTEDARDATQNALENALRALPRREPGRPLRPWLYRIAHNEAINIVRRRQPVADGGVDAVELLTVPGPEADAEQRSRLAQLVDDLRMLPERQRGALVMRELSGLSYEEISGALGVSNEAARRAVFDARTALHDAADGRATACVSVRRSLSDGDRRHLRARGVRAHLRSCDDCSSFERAMGARQTDLHLLGPWLSGSAALGLIGLGAGGAAGGTLVATGGGGAAVGGGLSWTGLPMIVKGLAVAAVVATTGTAAVQIPRVAAPDSPSSHAQAAATRHAGAPAPVAISPASRARNDRALAQAEAIRRARARRASAARADAGRVEAGAGSVAGAHALAKPTPARGTTAPVATQPAPSIANRPAARPPAPVAVRTPQQVAADSLQRIREQILAALTNAQTVATSGVQGALQTATSIVQNTLSSVRPLIERVLASVGMTLPSTTATAPASSSTSSPVTNVLAPVSSLLSGVNTLLQKLFGRR